MDGRTGAVIGVVGGCGGVGASRFAAALAATAADQAGRALLVDLDPAGGGLDVLLGVEAAVGARWSGLRLAGGVLDAQLLLSGLPAWGRTALLACDRSDLPPPDQVAQVLGAVRGAVPIVVDLSRNPSEPRQAAIECCTLVLAVCCCDLAALAGARAVVSALCLDERDGVPVGLVVRGGRSRAVQAAGLIGAPLAARLPVRRGRDGAPIEPDAVPRALRRVARGLLAGLPEPPIAAPGWVPQIELIR